MASAPGEVFGREVLMAGHRLRNPERNRASRFDPCPFRHLGPLVGIGIHSALKMRSRKAWGFESLKAHQLNDGHTRGNVRVFRSGAGAQTVTSRRGETADTHGRGPCASRRAGSSPAGGTIFRGSRSTVGPWTPNPSIGVQIAAAPPSRGRQDGQGKDLQSLHRRFDSGPRVQFRPVVNSVKAPRSDRGDSVGSIPTGPTNLSGKTI